MRTHTLLGRFLILGVLLMTVIVGTTEDTPNHHIKLAGTNNDGSSTTLGLLLCDTRGRPDAKGIQKMSYPSTALKIAQGNSGYGDFEMPYTPIVQSDWGGGRGQEEFEKDTSRFYDSYRCDTTRGKIEAGPLATESTGPTLTTIGDSHTNAQQEIPDVTPTPDVNAIASKFTVGASDFEMKSVEITAKANVLDAKETFVIRLYSHDAVNNEPDATLAYSFFQVSTLLVGIGNTIDISISLVYTLVAGTTYWIGIENPSHTELVSFNAYEGTGLTYGSCLYDATSGTWSAYTQTKELSFLINSTPVGERKFFEYKGAMYYFEIPDSGATPSLWMNGYRGMAGDNSGALNTTVTAINMATGYVDLTDKIIQIVSGPGITEKQTWRRIVSNTEANPTVLTVSPAWTVAQTTSTQFVILGCNSWTQITGTSSASSATNIKDMATLVTNPTDIQIVDDIIYIAQGSGKLMARMKLLATGLWADCFADSDYADFLQLVVDAEGARKIWRGEAVASLASSATPLASGATWDAAADLTWGSDITCGSTSVKITNLVAYGNPQQAWIMKEDSFGSINDGVYAEVPLSEMKNVRSELNGRAAMQHNLYLYFSMLDGIERYYNEQLDDLGPNRDAGLPEDRRGPVTKLLGYPGRIYAVVDGSEAGYASILCNNGVGWHEIYRGGYHNKIYDIFVQVIPGIAAEESIDRMWISENDRVYSIPIALNPRNTEDYRYHDGAYVISSWIYGGFKDVNKFFKSLSVFADDMASTTSVEVYYQVDEEGDTDAWHTLSTEYNTEPEQEIDFSATHNVFGKRIRYKIVLNANTAADTAPRVNAVRIDSVTRVPPKSAWKLTFLIEDCYTELDGIRNETTALSIATTLNEFADSDQYACPLLMTANFPLFDNKYVFVDPSSFQLMEAHHGQIMNDGQEHKIRAIGQVTVYEV